MDDVDLFFFLVLFLPFLFIFHFTLSFIKKNCYFIFSMSTHWFFGIILIIFIYFLFQFLIFIYPLIFHLFQNHLLSIYFIHKFLSCCVFFLLHIVINVYYSFICSIFFVYFHNFSFFHIFIYFTYILDN